MTVEQMIKLIQDIEKERYSELYNRLKENNWAEDELTNIYRQRWSAIHELCDSLNIPT